MIMVLVIGYYGIMESSFCFIITIMVTKGDFGYRLFGLRVFKKIAVIGYPQWLLSLQFYLALHRYLLLTATVSQ